MQLTIIFNDKDKTLSSYEVVSWEAHTYGFLQLTYASGDSEFINLGSVFSFKVPASR